MRVSVTDLASIEAHGYKIGRWGDGWTLAYADDPTGYLLIGDHGCVAPRQVDAVAEALHRIATDTEAENATLTARERGAESLPMKAGVRWQRHQTHEEKR